MSQYIKRGQMIYLIRNEQRFSTTARSVAAWMKVQGFKEISKQEFERTGKRGTR